ncbi:ankyrin repeat and LEM domain-containing protein 1-like [Bacillus rossius redtenbacheri]|uniref:ankyrin repeat and LEM domain-containing protein 1-like n=1 Tax=Bacillus rossius redtenbacheri TaxID=93214 RepID=UPI002FDD3C72
METVCPYAALEQTVSQQFSAPGPGLWWEGSSNTRCNYLLLDPRRLPRDDEPLDARRRWAAFLDAIFYIGQGRSFRQHAHMLEAASALRERARSRSGKVKMILDIWEEGQGVVSYLVFCNIVQEEARTREAAMIDALGIDFLTNERKGSYHGVAREWSQKQKQQLGTYLLYKAFHQFRSERAHHIRPCDLGIWCGK